MFLSREEIKDLTGYQRPSAQSRWLQRKGYRYETGADGYPRVLKRLVDAKLGYIETNCQREEPNFASLYIKNC